MSPPQPLEPPPVDREATTSEASTPLRIPRRVVWQVPLVLGVLHLVLGVALLVWPESTVLVVAVLVGLELVIGGLFRLLLALASHDEARAVRAVLGLLGVLAGVLVVSQPLRSVELAVLVLGVFWVVWGLAEVFIGLTPSAEGQRAPLLAEGGLVLAGGVLLTAWPAPTLRVVTVLVGILFVLAGALATWAGWRLRGVLDDVG